jgi:hypothetical protein
MLIQKRGFGVDSTSVECFFFSSPLAVLGDAAVGEDGTVGAVLLVKFDAALARPARFHHAPDAHLVARSVAAQIET